MANVTISTSTVGTALLVTQTGLAYGNMITYDGTKWINATEIKQNISANAAPTITRESTSSTGARTTFRLRKTLTSGSRANNDGPNLVWSYIDSTGGYDYGGMRFRYQTSGNHDIIAFFSNDPTNATTPSTTIFTVGNVTALFTGAVQSSNSANAIGYATGAGSTVTQLTSKSTGVTIDTPTGEITTNAAALNSATNVSFTVTNSSIAGTDSVIVNLVSGTANNTSYWVWAGQIAAGSFQIGIRNITGGTLSEALVLRYSIIRGVSA